MFLLLCVSVTWCGHTARAIAQEECSLPASGNSAVERLCDVADGMARFRIGGNWGYLDRMGQVAIEPQFSDAGDFVAGAAAVAKEGKWGLVDRTGRWLIEPRFEALDALSNGLAVAEENGKSGYVDQTGRWVISPQYLLAGPFNGKTAVVSEAYLRDRLIDGTGKQIKAFPNDTSVYVFPTSAGLYSARVQGRRALQRVDGKAIAYPARVQAAGRASDGVIVATRDPLPGEPATHLWGAVDFEGRWLVEPKYTMLEPFRAGLAVAQLAVAGGTARVGLIDKHGTVVVPLQYASVTRSDRGWYRARLESGADHIFAESGERLATFDCGESIEASSLSLGDVKRWSVLHGCGQTWIIADGRRAFRGTLVPTDVQVTMSHVLLITATDSSTDDKRPTQFELFDEAGKRVLSQPDVRFTGPYDSIVLIAADSANATAAWQKTPLALLIRGYERVEVVTQDYKVVRDVDWLYDSQVSRYGYTSSTQSLQGPLPLKAAQGWGAVDAQGRWVVPPRYFELSTFRDGVAFARSEARELIVDQDGKEYSFPESGRQFVRVAPRLLVGQGEEGQLIRLDLTTGASTARNDVGYFDAARFYGGHAAVRDSVGKYGLIDTAGNSVVAARYASPLEAIFDDGSRFGDDPRRFVGWLTSDTVKTDRGTATLRGWIDAAGVERLLPQFEELRFDPEARVLFGKRDRIEGVYSLDGRILIERRYASVEYYGDGWYATTEPERNGLLDANGDWVFEPAPLDLSDNRAGRFEMFERNGETILIDAHGRQSSRAKPLQITPDDPSLWWTTDAHQSYDTGTDYFGVDFKKRIRVPGIVRAWQAFSEGVVAFQPLERTEQQNVGLVEFTGKVLGLYPFDSIEPMRNGYARFQVVTPSKDDSESAVSKTGFLSRSGKIALPATFDAANDFVDERAAVVVEGNLAMIDTTGKVLVSGAWLCGDKPVLVDGRGAIQWPAAARGVTRCAP